MDKNIGHKKKFSLADIAGVQSNFRPNSNLYKE